MGFGWPSEACKIMSPTLVEEDEEREESREPERVRSWVGGRRWEDGGRIMRGGATQAVLYKDISGRRGRQGETDGFISA